jgi:hypothetical protein
MPTIHSLPGLFENIDGIAIFKLENNPPVCADSHGPETLHIALEWMQAIPGVDQGPAVSLPNPGALEIRWQRQDYATSGTLRG